MRSLHLVPGILALGLLVAARAEDATKPVKVVLVGVDQKTLDALGPWGGRYRPNHPKLIEQLNKAGVRGIAFDVFFPENPDFADATAAIAAAAKGSKAPVVIGRLPEEPNAQVLRDAKVIEANVQERGILDVEKAIATRKPVSTGAALPAEHTGLRPLSLEVMIRAGVLTEEDAKKLAQDVPVGVSSDGTTVKTETMKGYPVPYGDPKNLTVVSYVDVLQGKVDPKVLEGAVVVVGMTDGKLDMVDHPVTGKKVPGVYFHAFALEGFAKFAASKPSASKGLVGGLTGASEKR